MQFLRRSQKIVSFPVAIRFYHRNVRWNCSNEKVCFPMSRFEHLSRAREIRNFSIRSSSDNKEDFIIDENSWASDRLSELGEKVAPAPEEMPVEGTEELLLNPSEKVKSLIKQVLALNCIEINQLLKGLQVSKCP